MTLLSLVQLCDAGYTRDFPESSLLQFVNQKTGQPLQHQPGGDTLALFVVREFSETFDSEASDHEQISEAARVMTVARDNLQNVIDALEKRRSV